MCFNTRPKNLLALALLTVFSGCAHTTQSVRTINSATQTPTQTLNTYAQESQKKDLELVIAEEVEQKPQFLRKVNNKKVDFWVNYFSKREKARFERFLKNGAKYQATIERIFDDYGLPKELFYVGLIESGYYLGAKSHAGAVGPWQFIRDTAKRYNLTIRGGIDERRSIVKATQAAALYFQDLYNIFGDWELALSAYNAGEYGVVRRIRKAKTRDYYELSAKKVLPKETRHYVPKVLAAMEIVQNPKKYGINLPKQKQDRYANTKEITIKRRVSLSYLAKKTGVPKSTILALNPDLYWRTIPYVRNGFTLHLPNKNYKVIKEINTRRRVASSTSTYRVKSGDNLSTIAKRFNVGLSELKQANNLRRSNFLRVGQRLKIPGDGARQKYSVYKVRRGDNLYELARRYNTSISKILKLNSLRKRTIYVGQRLKLPSLDKRFYTVRPGDYLIKIAKAHGTTVSQLKRLNSIKSRIYPGQKLVVDIN
ncbi:MAG: LysM peptidoglycan-binding domain-containing protein [Bacteriovoracaceae bacterium]|nr:LysM peptidoglycan-binding domain-containing protein [Bacteriovoracaceae bacterium]